MTVVNYQVTIKYIFETISDKYICEYHRYNDYKDFPLQQHLPHDQLLVVTQDLM